MTSSILTIFKKELARFFGDKRMVFSTILLPGLLIFVMYSIMGNAITNMTTVDQDYVPSIAVVDLPDSIASVAEGGQLALTAASREELDTVKAKITDQEQDLLVVFPPDFDQAVAAYDSQAGTTAPLVAIYYNTASPSSQSAYARMVALLDQYESQLANKFDVNMGGDTYDLATQKDTSGSIFASMLPLLLMIFLFSGCIAVAPESIAGEKERGTIATLLVTPVKRWELAIGKISALALIALLSGISSAAGTILSLPKLMGGATEGISANVYTLTDYLLIGAVILTTVLLLISLIAILSAYAKTIKEAQTLVMPLMIVVMMVGITAMFGEGAKTAAGYYFIPLYNSVQAMIGIFSFDVLPINILITAVSNLVYTGLGVFLLTKMFNSERIIFSK